MEKLESEVIEKSNNAIRTPAPMAQRLRHSSYHIFFGFDSRRRHEICPSGFKTGPTQPRELNVYDLQML